ncbi:single-stranded DNA-binding protein [Deinococcus gobiensis]|uniref:DdrB, radiation induced single-stranded DNA binding protein n=1 Tax=Deinococcus gobiensis (strain DSM 21396 / JCM 16679 / CGMCC 1.7299 / I-0) TaxID=745776 RepID=H8GUU4_DEIGI|nr:single-stranded DNA-binding protein [Deinococcus gobiensis]AFD24277.1 DdrB, radiation induced single-stranded DNA binding protein [Deinococcus gobiensis I-0]
MLRIEFVTDLGARVSVEVESADKLLEVQRQYGRLGWTSGEVPQGGYLFPLDNEQDFDWSLIGARKFTNNEGEDMVMHRGHAYRRRELEAVDSRKLKLPAAIKYSRGAKNTDPEHVREKADGEFEYVTLAIFRGGKRQERFAQPAGRSQPAQGSRPAAPAGNGPRPQAAPAGRPAPVAARPAPVAAAVADEEPPF